MYFDQAFDFDALPDEDDDAGDGEPALALDGGAEPERPRLETVAPGGTGGPGGEGACEGSRSRHAICAEYCPRANLDAEDLPSRLPAGSGGAQAQASAGGQSILAFGIGAFDCTGLVRGSSPHLPMRLPARPHTPAEGEWKAGPAVRDHGGTSSSALAGPTGSIGLQWAGPRVDFQIREEVLPMCLEEEGMTVQDVATIWEKEWGCKFAGRLKFEAPPSSSVKWLPRAAVVPSHPIMVRLEGPGAILDSITVALRRHGRKMAEV